MFHRTRFIFLLFFFFTTAQISCMENKLVIVNLDELKDLVKEYSRKAVHETIRNNSSSYFSSTLQFAADNYTRIGQVFFYSTLVAAILGFSASKYYWLTPKKLDALLQEKEQKAINDIDQLKELVDGSRETVKQIYMENLVGIQAGFAALGVTIEQSETKLKSRFAAVYKDERKRFSTLSKKSKAISRSMREGIQVSDVTVEKAGKHLQEAQENITMLSAQEKDLKDLDHDIEEEFDTTEKELSSFHDQEHSTLQSLISKMAGDKEGIQQTLVLTELTIKILGEKFNQMNSRNEENQKKIQEAFEILKQQEELMDQLESLINNPNAHRDNGFIDQFNLLIPDHIPLPGSK